MKKGIGLFLIFILMAESALTAQGSPRPKPVSVSYEKLRQCFPEIQDEKLSFKVELNRLKELSDALFVSTQSTLRLRKIQYLNTENQTMNLILRVNSESSKKPETQLTLQTVDPKGVIADVALTRNQSLNPKQEMINNLLLGAKILSDETWFLDTKLKGMTAAYKKNFKEVVEYELKAPNPTRRLACDLQKDLGIICTCTKK